MSRRIVFAALMVIALAGCSDQLEKKGEVRAPEAAMGPHGHLAFQRQEGAANNPQPPGMPGLPGGNAVAGAQQPGGGPAKQPSDPAMQRKIIYNGSVNVVVSDLDAAAKSIQKLVDDHRGYIARSDLRGAKGETRESSFTLRIPAAKFAVVLQALAALGETESVRSDSQDVTEEFVDLESRIKNKQVEEKRLLEHLQKSTGKLEDILTIEKELSRVRGEIEQAQGRLNKLSDLTAFTTIIVTLREHTKYVPPTTPTYGTSAGRTLAESWSTFVGLFKFIGIVLVALLPWAPLFLPPAAIATWLVRRHLRQQREAAVELTPKLTAAESQNP